MLSSSQQIPPDDSAQTLSRTDSRARDYLGLLMAILVCLVAMLAYYLWASYQQAVQAAEITTRNLVQVMEAQLRGDLQRSAGLLEFIAKEVRPEQMRQGALTAQRAGLPARMANLILTSPQVALANIFDAEGNLLYSSSPSTAKFNIADRPFFKPLRDNPKQGFIFSDPQISRSTGHLALVLLKAIRDDSGKFLGVTSAVINLDDYAKLFGSINVGPGGVILIRRSDNFKLILRYPQSGEKGFNEVLPANNPIRQRIDAGERTGTLSYAASFDGFERIASFRKLDDYPFYVQVAQARSHYLAAWHLQASIAGVLTAFFLLIFGFAIVRMLRADSRTTAVARKLAYREALFSALFEQSNFLAGILDNKGHLLEVNDRALVVIGGRREDVLGRYFPGMPWWSRAEDKAALEEILRVAVQGKNGTIEVCHPIADDGEITVLFHAIPVQTGLESFIAVTGVDITELKRTQRLLEGSEKRMELALQGGDLGMWDWHIPSGALTFNERWCSMLGYSLDEIKPHLDSWGHLVHPDDWNAIRAVLEPHLRGESATYECEHRMRHKDGHWVWILDRAKVVERDAAGAPLRAVGTHMDISVRKQAEAEILRSNRELEQFSYSISHDMRQPLRMISSYLQLLEMSLAKQLDGEKKEYFHFAIDGAKRLDTMLLGLLEYSRIGHKGEPAWIESRNVLNDALLFLQPAISEAEAEVRIEGDWPRIFVRTDEVLRLIQNLIGNAIKFRVAGRRPEITVSSEIVEGCWNLCVTDNGVGILPDQAGRLFQIFQRLQSRATYEGTGIGLALCRKIAEHHGGSIRAESQGEGMGSCFQVVVPLPQEIST